MNQLSSYTIQKTGPFNSPATTGAAGGAEVVVSLCSSVAGVVELLTSGTMGAEAVIKEPAGISVVTEGAASDVADGVTSFSVSVGATSSDSFFDFSFDGERSEITRAERRRPSLVCRDDKIV